MPRLLHVTDVLRPLYTGRPSDPWYLERGVAVHKSCELLDLGHLDRASVDPQIEGYVAAWERCRAETCVRIIAVEQRVGGPMFGYVGTLDRIVQAQDRTEIWDIKTGGPHVSHGLQLAAYLHGTNSLNEMSKKRTVRRTCHLGGDGTYKLVEHDNRGDLKAFLAMLATAYWRIENGIDQWPALRDGEE